MTERWYTVQVGTSSLIQSGDVVVGSIAERERAGTFYARDFLVEIMWSGPGGDITGEFRTKEEALAFVEGVEKTLIALGLNDPRRRALSQQNRKTEAEHGT